MSREPLFGNVSLSRSGIVISRIGFGCARVFSGSEYRSSAKLIEAALEVGIRHFDTAPSYGDGHSEAVLGQVLSGVPNVTIATKVGAPTFVRTTVPAWSRSLYRKVARPLLARVPSVKRRLMRALAPQTPTPGSAGQISELSRDMVLRSVELSLTRLRRSSMDLLLVHEPQRHIFETHLEDLFAQLQVDGVIGTFGLAWGGAPQPGIKFGDVVQARYTPSVYQDTSDHAFIFHGVLRHGYATSARRISPSEYLHEVLHRHDKAAVIFSASTPSQIRDIAARTTNARR